MDFFKAVRLIALKQVQDPDRDYLVRKVHRWYSKTFSTPLAEVYDLPLEDVFQAYFEERYEDMSEEDRDTERLELLETEAQRIARLRREDEDEADADAYARIVAEEEKAAAEAKAKKKTEQPMLGEVPDRPTLGVGSSISRESVLPTVPKELPPNITMQFVDPDEFENEIEGFGAMAPPPKQSS